MNCTNFKNKSLSSTSNLHYGLTLDITGTERLHKSERRLAHQLLQKLFAHNIEARIAAAPTIGAAWALARFSNQIFSELACGQSIRNSCFTELPVSALRISESTACSLHELGIYTISDLLKLPRRKLARRFGLLLLKRLDQAFGLVQEILLTIPASAQYVRSRSFEIPLLSQQAIKKVILGFLEDILSNLHKLKRKAGSFVIIAQTPQGSPILKELTLHSSSCSISHISSILDSTIESFKEIHGVSSLTLIARDTERHSDQQSDFFNNNNDLELVKLAYEQTLNTLTTRLGERNVLGINFQNSHIPEKAFSYQPLKNPRDLNIESRPETFANRPSHLFAKPLPIKAISLLPDSPPSRITWDNQEFKVLSGIGPERIISEWWHGELETQNAVRDYFKILDQSGRWLWIFRHLESQKWFVHGVWS